MNRYLELFRLENGIIGIVGIVVAAYIAVGNGIVDHIQNIAITCLITICFIAGGNSINDYVDREIDKVSHPERPIPSGRLEPRSALIVGSVSLALSCILSLFLGSIQSTLIVIIAVILMLGYELTLKQRGFVGNLTIGVLTGMVFLLGGSITGNIESSYEVACMAALVTVGREITKDIEDMEGDEGRHTLPMLIGKRNAGIVAAAFFIAGPILSILPIIQGTFSTLYYTVLIADAMFIYTAIILFNNPHKAQRMAKYAMIVALVAFILGAI